MICLKVLCEPVGKGRPKFTVRNGFVHAYTPRKTKEFEDKVTAEFLRVNKERMPVYDSSVPISMDMTFAFSVPKSYSKKDRAACLNGEKQHLKKPDADNVAKSVCDALSGYAFADDSQVTTMRMEKIYAGEPYVEIKIYPAGGEDEREQIY